ncbi:uncharacterized protein LOC119078284 [Bradysia coprophila]|uniref:uncharacterized protein LOC119078284 n=1 Tax=Bradysia coprophila TaxID=38358 RepID=UPI00187DA8C7|nr:uncharacterized protein LOC119078284 [Bradysia coprophila]
MAASLDQHEQYKTPNVILLLHKDSLQYSTVGDYPEFETKRPLRRFVPLDRSSEIKFLKTIALLVVHIVIDPLFYDEEFLKLVRTMCGNIKRLTIDANLLEQAECTYKQKMVDVTNPEAMFLTLETFIAGLDGIEELYFGPMLHLTEEFYEETFKRPPRYEGKVCGCVEPTHYHPKFSTDVINSLNSSLKKIFFNNAQVDAFDLREIADTCPIVIIPMCVSDENPFLKQKGEFLHTCLNRLTNLRALSIEYFDNCYHSETVQELILNTLSGDFKIHEMFPNVKTLRVRIFCPFVMDMSKTGNEGLYDDVVLDELEVEEQIPCFCNGQPDVKSSDDHGDIELQTLLHSSFLRCSLGIESSRNQCNINCHCVDVAKIGLLKNLNVIKLRCFDDMVARFISNLQESGSTANIIVYEKSRFEGSGDHHSLWNNLVSLAETMKIVPHDKIEVVMKKVNDDIKMKRIRNKLGQFIPDDVKITFAE